MQPCETAPQGAKPPPDTLVHRLDRAAASLPERAALSFGDQVLSYAQLRACADAAMALKPQLRVLLQYHCGSPVLRTRQLMMDLQSL